MGTAMYNQSFNGGEISELMYGRPDQQRYQTGCFTLKNMICLPQGPATRRPGMRYLGTVGETTISNNVRIVPFVFSSTESRVLEFGHNYIRVWKDDALVQDGGSPYEETTTYTSAQLPNLRFAQSADVVYIASPDHPPKKLSRYDDDDWRLETINFVPTTPTPASATVVNTTTVNTTGQSTYKYKVTAINATTGEESLPSNEASVTCDILNKTDGNYNTISWTAITPAPLEYRVYKYEAGVYGYIGTATHPTVTFQDDNIGADEDDAPPDGNDPFDSADNYPSIVFFWQQRLGWAATNTQPFTVWLSPSAQFESLSSATPPADDDAIEATLAAVRANKIQWIEGDRSLVLGTTGNEWSMGGTDGEVLTPSNPGFNKQGGKGSEAIPALLAGDGMLYVQRGGGAIREFVYSYESDKYKAPDASIIASHLLDGKEVVSWCYQSNPYSIVWVVFDDGTMAGMTYVREHEVLGWHQHETVGEIEDVCSVPSPDGYDHVFFVVKREINGTDARFIERFDNYFVKLDDPEDAFFVDSGVEYDSTEASTLTDIAPHLVGETVKVWADGAEQGEVVVATGGTVTLQAPASHVVVGLGMTSDLVPARPEIMQTQTGTTMNRVYKVGTANIKFYRSMSVQVGASEDELEEVLKHDASDPLPPAYATRSEEVQIDTGWDSEWGFLMRSEGPAPMTVLSVVYDVEIGDSI